MSKLEELFGPADIVLENVRFVDLHLKPGESVKTSYGTIESLGKIGDIPAHKIREIAPFLFDP